MELLPEPEALGLLALMLLHESRRAARTSPAATDPARGPGPLAAGTGQIAEGPRWSSGRSRSRRFGPYTLQAAIAAVHAEAPTAAETDWAQIVGLYDVLCAVEPSPVVELNRAVAVAMRDGPAAGLALIDALLARGARGLSPGPRGARGPVPPARQAGGGPRLLRAALGLARQAPERRFLERRIHEVSRP